MRLGRGSSETGAQRAGKRKRLGNAADRALYKGVKGHKLKSNRYAMICKVADSLNGNKR